MANRLAKEKSPYLLQHAQNPVDWYPWGEEAFRKAKSENKPIFLSIGYSTCHWCHVMEEESFVNPEIAKILNDHFVSIKVDREERPDIDHIYMQAVMAMTGAGGWPMSVFLTHDLKPFYGGTYFPPTDKWGRPGFLTLLKAIHEKWISEHDQILKSGEEMARALNDETKQKAKGGGASLNEGTLKIAYEQLASRFDSNKGGFSDAPKFPQSYVLSFLLRYWKRAGETEALEMAQKTFDEMAKGGMYDHLGGGFHRYATDAEWHVPHFEKMLYDQATLAKSYLEAYQATKKDSYAQVAREIFEYVLRDMTPSPAFGLKGRLPSEGSPSAKNAGDGVTDPKGGFYSAEDADSLPAGQAGAADPAVPNQKTEGAFYVWTSDEIEKQLGKENAEIFNFHFGVLPEGNAAEDPHGEFKGKNILYLDHSTDETAAKFKKSPEEISRILESSKRKLFEIRNHRPRPHLDDKILTDWNGLMISAMAFGSRVLNESRYCDAAKKAADFVINQMKVNGRLMHRYRDGEVSVPGFAEDYAFLIHGLIDLYEATFEERYLEEAKFLIHEMIRLFWDESGGGFFFSGKDAEKLISRTKEVYDGAVPSGNSIAALSLLRLSRLITDPKLDPFAQKIFEAFSNQIASYPSAYGQMLIALDFALGPSREVMIAGIKSDPQIQKIATQIFDRFAPNQVVHLHSAAGPATVSICQNSVCGPALKDLSQLEQFLDT